MDYSCYIIKNTIINQKLSDVLVKVVKEFDEILEFKIRSEMSEKYYFFTFFLFLRNLLNL